MNRFLVALAPLALVVGGASVARAQAHDPHASHATQQRPPAPAPDPHAGHRQPAPAPQTDPHAGHAAPTPGDHHAGHRMEPAPAAQAAPADPHAGHAMPAAASPTPHAGHAMAPAPQADPHAGHDMGGAAAPPDVPTSADNPGRPPEDPTPAAAAAGPAHAADLYFDPAAMAAARGIMRRENGDVRATAVFLDQVEATFGDGEEGYAWEAQGWTGGDINRFWWKSEGEGVFGEEIEEAELQALYSRAVTPFFDVQAGLRQTWSDDGDRTDLVLGVQGLAPHWFEVDAAAFLSSEGDLTARAEAEYDQRLTNRWILQPRAEVSLSAQDIPELSIGSGLTSLQLGARLRYEVRKEFAPYVGIEWTRSFGDTADYLEAAGHDAEETRFVVGLKAWF